VDQSTQQTQQLLELVSRLASNGTLAVVIVAVMQWLKKSPLAPWLSQETDNANRLVSAFLAFIASVGITYTYTGGVVTITFTLMTVLTGLWHWIQQMAFQQFLYHGWVKPRTVEVENIANVKQ